MTRAGDLCGRSVDSVVDTLGLEEITVDEGPYMVLRSEMMPEPVGSVRVFHREDGTTLVYVGMAVAPIGLDSHMMFAFTPPDSAVPHFTVDSVQNADDFAFHLDLIPRIDLGAHLAYMDHCFTPLTELREKGLGVDGLTPAHLAPRQWALMSEWMLANRATPDAFAAIGPIVDGYRDHWFSLVSEGVPDDLLEGVDAEALRRRDEANREAIFNPDVDKVWANVARLLGEDRSEEVRRFVAGAGREAVTA